MVSVPFCTYRPPTMTTSAVPTIVIVLTTTENSELCQVIAMRAFIVFSPACVYRSSSCGSRAKLLTSLMAPKVSYRRSSSFDSSSFTRSSRLTSVDV